MEQFVAALVLLVIASGVNTLAKKFKLPYTILLFIVGIALIPLSNFLPFIGDFSLTPDLLFYVFLPILIFESAYNIKYELLHKNRVTIWSLATIGLIISALGIGAGLYFFLRRVGVEIPFMITLLFGIIISATDPVAVLALFKDLGTPKRLSLLFEGESLFNDGTAVALFLIIIEVIKAGVLNGKVIGVGILQFLIMILGGIGLGVGLGIVFSKGIKLIKNNESVEIMLTMLLAHFTFILAEIISHHVMIGGFDLKISGVIATAYAAIIMGNYGKTKISPKVENYMEKFWNFFAFLANSLIFLLMGLVIKEISIPISEAWLPVISAIVFVTIMRIVSVYLPVGVLNIFLCKKKKVPRKWQHLMAWGDLRGVVGLTLALMIPADLHVIGWSLLYSPKEYILLLVVSVIIFSLIFKGLTMKGFINKLGLNKLKTLEIFEQYETEILIYDRILKKIEKMGEDFHTSKKNYKSLYEKYQGKQHKSRLKMQAFLSKRKDPDILVKKAIALHALGVEKGYLQQMFTYNEINEHLYLHWMAKIDRQTGRIESGQKQIKGTGRRTESSFMLRLFSKSYDYKEMSEHDLYIIFRTKFIITGKVLKQLDFLKKIDFHYDNKLILEVRKLYAHFHSNANEQIELLKKNNPDFIFQTNGKLLSKGLMKSEERILDDLYHKEMITHKLYKKFMQEAEDEIMEKC